MVGRIVGNNPCLTLSEVGKLAGVTRERVRQIVEKDGLARIKNARVRGKPVRPHRPCGVCGEPMGTAVKGPKHARCARWVPFVCRQCGKDFQLRESQVLGVINNGKEAGIFCSNRCKWDSFRKHPDLTLNCHICGVEFTADACQRSQFYNNGQRRFGCSLHGKEMMQLGAADWRAARMAKRAVEAAV